MAGLLLSRAKGLLLAQPSSLLGALSPLVKLLGSEGGWLLFSSGVNLSLDGEQTDLSPVETGVATGDRLPGEARPGAVVAWLVEDGGVTGAMGRLGVGKEGLREACDVKPGGRPKPREVLHCAIISSFIMPNASMPGIPEAEGKVKSGWRWAPLLATPLAFSTPGN